MPQFKKVALFLSVKMMIVLCLPNISYGEDDCEIGKCVEVIDCPSALHSIHTRGDHNLERCGWNKLIEKVCCLEDGGDSIHSSVSEETTSSAGNIDEGTSTSSTTMMPISTTKKNEPRGTVRKSEEACARYGANVPFQINYHILGGESAEVGEFPHMAALGYPNNQGGTDLMWICGGSLISERYILTAAHCVNRQIPVRVLLGVLNITEQSATRREYIIQNITIHSGYRRQNGSHDIALVQTTETIQFGVNLYPACLYQRSDDPLGLVITGWGKILLGQDLRSDILQKARVVAVPLATCNETYVKSLNRLITINQICAGPIDLMNPTDSCPGDSGGPMQVLAQDNFMYEVVGIVSFGLTDCGGVAASVYTRVYQYLDWIEPIVWL